MRERGGLPSTFRKNGSGNHRRSAGVKGQFNAKKGPVVRSSQRRRRGSGRLGGFTTRAPPGGGRPRRGRRAPRPYPPPLTPGLRPRARMDLSRGLFGPTQVGERRWAPPGLSVEGRGARGPCRCRRGSGGGPPGCPRPRSSARRGRPGPVGTALSPSRHPEGPTLLLSPLSLREDRLLDARAHS